MNEAQENKVEETSNENEFVVEVDENQESTKKEAQPEKEEQTIVRSEESDEHESYSEKVQKRIDQLTAKRKAAEDDMNNAIKYGKQVEEENQRLKKQLETYTNGYTNEFDTRVQSQEAQVKQLLKEAYDAQDVEKIAEASELLLKSILKKKDLESSSNKESKNKQLKKMHDRAVKKKK